MIARWSGTEVATFKITEPRGAPILAASAVIHGRSGTVTWTRREPGSTGESVRFFAIADDPVQAHALDENRARFSNTGQRPVELTVRYVDITGNELAAARVLKPGETADVKPSGRELTVGSPVEH